MSDFDKRCANKKPFAHPTQARAACFVAGTLVHTQQGLVPIEKLKVGDYVLSKPESGEGEQSYQRVTETFVHEEQEILLIDIDGYSVQDHEAAIKTGALVDDSADFPLIVTANHPFWVVGKGWVEALRLKPGVDVIVIADGSHHGVGNKHRVVRTLNKDTGWLIRGTFCPIVFTENVSRIIDLSNNAISSSYEIEDRVENEGVEWWDECEQDRMRRTVYNITVENTHTYYVGELGVWVHNKI